MRIVLKAVGFALLVIPAAFAASLLADLVATGGEDSMPALAGLAALALVALGGALLWRSAERRPQPPLHNPAWHLAALLAGVMLALLAGSVFALAMASVLSNAGQPEAAAALWGLLVFFGGVALGGTLLARGETLRLARANRQAAERAAARPGPITRPRSSWPRRWGMARVAASLLLGLALVQGGMALVTRSQTSNGMDVGAGVAGVFATLALVLAAAVFVTAGLTLVALLRPGTLSGLLAGSVSFVVGATGILVALVASATLTAGSGLLTLAVLAFLTAYFGSMLSFARVSSAGAASEPDSLQQQRQE